MKKVLSLILCVVLGLSFTACNQTNTSATSSSVSASPIASFDTVESFNIALKKNPKQYMGNRISIRGYMDKLTLGTSIYTRLEDVHTPKDELKDLSVARIKLFITDRVMLTVVGHGDYVEVCGTVEIKDGEICLNNCMCTVITAFEEIK